MKGFVAASKLVQTLINQVRSLNFSEILNKTVNEKNPIKNKCDERCLGMFYAGFIFSCDEI